MKEIVDQTCAELEVHARLEEELFYPAAREVLKEADLIDEAEVEHNSAKALIAQLREMVPRTKNMQQRSRFLANTSTITSRRKKTRCFQAWKDARVRQWEEVRNR